LRDRFSKHQDKGLHENDFIMASKIDRMADRPGPTPPELRRDLARC
jgi:hypothetical protein